MNTYAMDPNAMGSGSMLGMAVGGLFALAVALFFIFVGWKIYSKAGKPGWAILIPIYNTLMMLEICGRPWWWLFLLMIPFVNIIFSIILTVDLCQRFGKGGGFVVGMLLLPFIFAPILAFDSSRYTPPPARI